MVSNRLNLNRRVRGCHVFWRLHSKPPICLCLQNLRSGAELTQAFFCQLFNWDLLGTDSHVSFWATHKPFFWLLHRLVIISFESMFLLNAKIFSLLWRSHRLSHCLLQILERGSSQKLALKQLKWLLKFDIIAKFMHDLSKSVSNLDVSHMCVPSPRTVVSVIGWIFYHMDYYWAYFALNNKSIEKPNSKFGLR